MNRLWRVLPYIVLAVVFVIVVGQQQDQKNQLASQKNQLAVENFTLRREVARAQYAECKVGLKNHNAIVRIINSGPADPLVIDPALAPGVGEPTIHLIENILNHANTRSDVQKTAALKALGPAPICTKPRATK